MSSLALVQPRSPRTTLAAASLARLVEPARAESGRSRKRSAVEVAEEEVLKVSSATTKLEKDLEVLLAKGVPANVRAMEKLQNKRVKLSAMRDVTLPKATADGELVADGLPLLVGEGLA